MGKIIAVTGATNRSGKTVVLVNLATLLAPSYKVLLVNASDETYASDFTRWFQVPPTAPGAPGARPRPQLSERREFITPQLHLVRYVAAAADQLETLRPSYDYILVKQTHHQTVWHPAVQSDLVLVAGGMRGIECQMLDSRCADLEEVGAKMRLVFQRPWWPDRKGFQSKSLRRFTRTHEVMYPSVESHFLKIRSDPKYRRATDEARPVPADSRCWADYQLLIKEIEVVC